MTTNYVGINYGSGQSNRDKETGIRYGVISQHSLNHDALEDIFQNGRDLDFEAYQQEAVDKIRDALSDYFSDYKHGDNKHSRLDVQSEAAFDAVKDAIGEQYEPQNLSMLYESDGYKLTTCLDSDLMILNSPYYTYAQFCSPCVPGACNLNSPLGEPVEANKCYCLGHDWFENSKAPYPVYSVETGELVSP